MSYRTLWTPLRENILRLDFPQMTAPSLRPLNLQLVPVTHQAYFFPLRTFAGPFLLLSLFLCFASHEKETLRAFTTFFLKGGQSYGAEGRGHVSPPPISSPISWMFLNLKRWEHLPFAHLFSLAFLVSFTNNFFLSWSPFTLLHLQVPWISFKDLWDRFPGPTFFRCWKTRSYILPNLFSSTS